MMAGCWLTVPVQRGPLMSDANRIQIHARLYRVKTRTEPVASQALSGTLLLVTPCDDLCMSSARMLPSIQHTLPRSFSVYTTRTQPCGRTSCARSVKKAYRPRVLLSRLYLGSHGYLALPSLPAMQLEVNCKICLCSREHGLN